MNYYKAFQKKPEHGGGWAFMGLNRREGAHIECACTWDDEGHETAEAAERCFWEHAQKQGVKWSEQSQASRCVICDEWTPHLLDFQHRLLFGSTDPVCPSHFTDDDAAAAWMWDRHPFRPGIEMAASW